MFNSEQKAQECDATEVKWNCFSWVQKLKTPI
jgi:hypothetical protein